MMYIHNIDSTIISFGVLEIRWYGLVYVLGFVLAYYFLLKNREKLDLSKDDVADYLFYFFIGMMIGARLMHFLINDPAVFLKDPLEIFKIWHGGMSFFGSLIGSVTGTIIFCRKKGKDWFKIVDVIILPAAFSLALGRIANFLNGELVGTASDLPWCVIFPMFDSVCRHPYQIYASLSHFLLFGLLYLFYRKDPQKGKMFFGFVIGYSAIRFLTDFFRYEPRYHGVTSWQIISAVVFFVGIGFYYYYYYYHHRKS